MEEEKNGEAILSGIEVSLVNKKTGAFVENINGGRKIVLTDLTGKYKFDRLIPGEYIVLFEYNTEENTVTQYQKSGVSEDINSDAQNRMVKINNETKLVALTDTVLISNKNQTNIDIGLIDNAKFDLSLSKSVSKIIVQNENETKTYNYENIDLAKIEIRAKDFEGSAVIIEYNIEIINEGETTGYVDNIIDYIPKELTFNSELNPTWYVATNGDLHNSSLMNEAILPGAKTNISLVLTKILDKDDIGLITNMAEIGQSYCLEGIQEYDSIYGNKNQDEDDIDKANVLIAVKTGGIELYIIITLISMTILSRRNIFNK